MSQCPCDSGRIDADCCDPILEGARAAADAEELLRSRYTAYVRGEIDYLLDTVHPERVDDHDPRSMRKWAEESEWEGLELISEHPTKNDAEARIEFVARYRAKNGERVAHHELASFENYAGRWVFVDGEAIAPQTQVRDVPKVGRNEPCPCGSGRKFKKCCGGN